ncbi:arylsulfatase B-like [Glandiceps talaboti]
MSRMKEWAAVLSIIVTCIAMVTATSDQKSPHIILVVIDDWGWGDVGFHHGARFSTPYIDELAYSSVILHNYYVQPLCTPARAALMTGRYPIHLGLQHYTVTGSRPFGLRLNETTMAEYLQRLGYSTHIVGKWHLGHFTKQHTPLYRGFDSFFGYYNGYQDYYDRLYEDLTLEDERPRVWGYDFRRNDNLDYSTYGHYTTDLLTDEALTIIKTHANTTPDKPLFLYLAHLGVHRGNTIYPLQAPDKYTSRFPYIQKESRKLVAGMVAAVDDSIGMVVKTLKDNNLYDDSVIVVTTDNGGAPDGFDWNDASNWPLRGGKNTLWEGGIRGTAFVHSTRLNVGNLPRYEMSLMHISDWLPTLYHAAGGAVEDLPKHLDGYDLWDTWTRGTPSRRTEILHNIDPISKTAALRVGDYKIITGREDLQYDGWYKPDELTEEILSQTKALNSPIFIDCGQKPVHAFENCKPIEKPCLFDISKDPCEFNNLADTYPDILKQLLSVLDKYIATAVEPMFPNNDPAADPIKHNGAWVSWVDPTCPLDVERYGQYF